MLSKIYLISHRPWASLDELRHAHFCYVLVLKFGFLIAKSMVVSGKDTVAVRKDDVSAADHAAMANVAGLRSISGCGGLIQTTSG